MLPAAFSAFELQPLPNGASTILRLLAAHSPNWPEVALVAARDPALSLALLLAEPLRSGELAEGLNTALRRRLERIGTDLLRAWLLGLGHSAAEAAEPPDHALLRAECALHLAIESGYARPDEAYLGGLWRGLAHSLTRPHPGQRSQPPALSTLIRDCGLPPSLADALETGPLLDEQLAQAHPLLRLLSAAELLAAANWMSALGRVATLLNMAPDALLSLRTDVSYIVSGHAAYPAVSAEAGPERRLPAHVSDDPYRSAGMLGLLTAAFVDLDSETVRNRLAIACPLFGLHTPPILLGTTPEGHLRPLTPSPAGSVGALIGELELRLTDEASIIALCARSEQGSSFFPPPHGPGRSMADWQIARWMGQHGFVCLPLTGGEQPTLALVACAHEDAIDNELRWRYAALLGAAARALRTVTRQQNELAEREATLHKRFHDHLRKIAHEATNPLAVLKSRIDMLALERTGDAPLQNEMALLNTELDRIDNLLRNAGKLPVDSPEAAHCRVPELLLDLRTLYGEPLFSNHGIQLELRAAKDVPPAAIPASALKQVLINLLRNTSEALQPGQRLVVSVFPKVSVDGRNCLEVRFVDNGPGLPADRVEDLFSPRPSIKGGRHQGVGLAVVREILTQWGATLLCRSQPGTGTSFQIFIPLEQLP